MMITHLDPALLREMDLVPQAVLNKPASYFAESLHLEVQSGNDDFDQFTGLSLCLNDETEFALRHYAGHPDDTTTIYLPREYADIEQITKLVGDIARELHVQRDILWQRADGPDL